MATLQGENQDLESWQAFLPSDWPLTDLAGRVSSLEVTLEKKPEGLKFAGEVKPAGISGRVAGFGFTDVNGFIVFSEKEARLYYTSGKLDGQPLAVRGKILRPLQEPEFDLQVTATGLDTSAWQSQAPFSGKLSVDAQLQGIWRNLKVSGKFWLEGGRLGAYEVSLADTGFTAARSGSDWSLQLQGGSGTLAGENAGAAERV